MQLVKITTNEAADTKFYVYELRASSSEEPLPMMLDSYAIMTTPSFKSVLAKMNQPTTTIISKRGKDTLQVRTLRALTNLPDVMELEE